MPLCKCYLLARLQMEQVSALIIVIIRAQLKQFTIQTGMLNPMTLKRFFLKMARLFGTKIDLNKYLNRGYGLARLALRIEKEVQISKKKKFLGILAELLHNSFKIHLKKIIIYMVFRIDS